MSEPDITKCKEECSKAEHITTNQISEPRKKENQKEQKIDPEITKYKEECIPLRKKGNERKVQRRMRPFQKERKQKSRPQS